MRMTYPAAEGLGGSLEHEISEGGTMLDSKGKFSDLKTMLDSNRENIKMDAMRRIINMVARGRDVSELFPAVVKNVAAKNLELKKLVYVYLVRYAEEQQDLALLSISTFQRALKDPNQLIRASALRVLSSIRVQMISPVVMLAIKEAVRDMSPYVRKVAAHAIPKLFVLDRDLHSQLIECIDYLLGDKRTLVLGSAVYAFEETCPDRLDLLHRHFRLLCRALADVDEWGQVVMIGLLTRYARTQFTSPFVATTPNNQKRDDVGVEENERDYEDESCNEQRSLDPDHNLLIVSVRPLLQSRNPAVVMAVSQLLFHIAPHSHLTAVPKALVRLLRGPTEIQHIVLVNIATICATRQTEEMFSINKKLFEPFLKSFFVRNSDTLHVKKLKLHVLTSLLTESNVHLVIRELQAYLQMLDLAEAAIDAIGRCALEIPSSAETCLGYLIRLISMSTQDHIVCASVVVLKHLLYADAPFGLLKRMVRLINTVKAPMARSCILWLIGTHINKVSKLAPDSLRVVAKSFCEEDDSVKLQALNLAVRIWVIDPANREGRVALLVKYVFQLARYDRSYDIRDRCRFLRNFIFNDQRSDEIKFPMEIFLNQRPAPVVKSVFADRAEHFQLGTLSHFLNQKCNGYAELPEFPFELPDPSIRRNAYPLVADEVSAKGKEAVIADEVNEGSIEEYSTNDEDEDEDEENEEEDEDEDEEGSEEEDESQVGSDQQAEHIILNSATLDMSQTQEDYEEISEQRDEAQPLVAKNTKITQTNARKADELLLLDLDFSSSSAIYSGSIMSKWKRATAVYVPNEFELRLVESISSGGITVEGRFCRSPCLFSSSMVSVEMQISYRRQGLPSCDVCISPTKNCFLPTSGDVMLNSLQEGERRRITVGIDFGDSMQTSLWTIVWANGDKTANIEIQAQMTELVEAIELNSEQFVEHRTKLTGMSQIRHPICRTPDQFTARTLQKICNCKQVQGIKFSFASQTVSRKDLVLISLVEKEEDQNSWLMQVNCDNIAFASLLCKELVEKINSNP